MTSRIIGIQLFSESSKLTEERYVCMSSLCCLFSLSQQFFKGSILPTFHLIFCNKQKLIAAAIQQVQLMVNKQGQIVAPPKAQGFSSATPGASYSQTTNPPPMVPTIVAAGAAANITPGTGPYPYPPQYPPPTPNLAAQFPHGVYPPGYTAPAGFAPAPAAAPANGQPTPSQSPVPNAEGESKTETTDVANGDQKTENPPPPLPQATAEANPAVIAEANPAVTSAAEADTLAITSVTAETAETDTANPENEGEQEKVETPVVEEENENVALI